LNSAEDEDSKLSFLIRFAPNLNNVVFNVYSLAIFVLAIVLLRSQKQERQEGEKSEAFSRRVTDPITSISSMKAFEVRKAVQIIKNFKFFSSLTVYFELVLLTFICAASCSVVVVPYLVVAVYISATLAVRKKQKLLNEASHRCNLILLALLLIDLPSRYVVRSIYRANGVESFEEEVVGFLFTIPSYLDFYLKVLLFHVECQKLPYTYSYSELFNSLRAAFENSAGMEQFFKKKGSIMSWLLTPAIALFLFCFLEIWFALLHPSIFFLVLMPFYIYGFFKEPHEYRLVVNIFAILMALYMLAEYILTLALLLIGETQNIEELLTYENKILGISTSESLVMRLFPFHGDFIFYILLAVIAMFMRPKEP